MANGKQTIFQQLGITPVQAVGIGAAIIALYSIGRKFGLVKGEENDKADKLQSEKMFEPSYLQTLPASQKVMKFSNPKSVEDIAAKIKSAKGLFNDNEAQLWGAIKRMTYKTQVAQVNAYFTRKYGVEMFAYMKTFLNANELAEIYDYLKNLPSGLV